MKHLTKTTAIVLAVMALPLASLAIEKTQDPPNILFILADDMGYGDLGCYGAEKIKTPNIDRLSAEGILFTDGHCGASTCTPTRYGLLTGRHNWRTWLKYSALSTSAPLLIEEDRVTVASFLKSAGYSTSIVGKWHLGFGREEGFGDNRGDTPPNSWETRGSGPNWNGELKPGPLEVGFDYAYVIPVVNSFPPYVIVENHHVEGLRKDSPIGKMQSRNNGEMEGGEGARWKDEELVDKLTVKVVSQLEGFAKEKRPFFLYFAPHQPHVPNRPNTRFKGTSQAVAYGDVIQELDWSVGEILQTLDRLGIADDTLVIFSSDNGGFNRTFNGHQPNGHILRGGKGDLVEGGHRVPFLARWPGRIEPGTRSKETISTTDMLATFAAIVGKKLPAGAGPDSYNVLPALVGQKLPDPERPVVFSSGGTGALCIRMGKWKLLDGQGDCGFREHKSKGPWPEPKPGDPPAQLYNLDEDLGEHDNLYRKHPEIVHRMKVGLEKIKADENYNPTTLEQPKEKITLDQLDVLFARSKTVKPASRRKPKSAVPGNPPSQATLTELGGKIAAVSSFQPGREAAYMLDGDPSTFWHTRFDGGDAKPPHYVVLQVPAGTRVSGLSYTAWTGGNGNGHIKEFAISVSDDGKNWGDPILSGGLKTSTSGRQDITFPAPSVKPFIKFEVTVSHSPKGRFLAAIGELDVLVAAQSQKLSWRQPIGRSPSPRRYAVTHKASPTSCSSWQMTGRDCRSAASR